VKNTAKTAAMNVEVYASELLRSRADNVTWDRVGQLPTEDPRRGREHPCPTEKTISIVLTGAWYPDETKMLSDGVNVSIM
jgi:hypothetical protein